MSIIKTIVVSSNRARKILHYSLICSVFVGAFYVIPKTDVHSNAQPPDYRNPKLPVDVRVADLLKRMTLEEKVAQLVCLWMQKPQPKAAGDLSTDRGDFSPEKAR